MKAREGVMKSELFGDGTLITYTINPFRPVFCDFLEKQFASNSATYLMPNKNVSKIIFYLYVIIIILKIVNMIGMNSKLS